MVPIIGNKHKVHVNMTRITWFAIESKETFIHGNKISAYRTRNRKG